MWLLVGLLAVGCRKEQVVRIATQSPLSGDTQDTGTGIRNAASLAIDQLSGPIRKMGIRVELVPFDDRADPARGIENARTLAADPSVLAVIGHYDSGVEIPASEIYHTAGLCNLSPASTHPMVTDRGYAEVNRVCGRDEVQGAVGARLALNRGIRRVYIVHDTTPWGYGIAEVFRTRAEAQGIAITGFMGTRERKDFSGLVPAILRQQPEAVFLAAGYEASAILRQLRDQGFEGMFISTDGLDSPETARIAGDSLTTGGGTYFTTVAGPALAYPNAAKFACDYKGRFGSFPMPYAAQAYDCTALALKAIENEARAAGGKVPSRAHVVKAVRDLKDFPGVTGTLTLDDRGDPVTTRYFVIQVTSADPARWTANRVAETLDIPPPR